MDYADMIQHEDSVIAKHIASGEIVDTDDLAEHLDQILGPVAFDPSLYHYLYGILYPFWRKKLATN